MSAAGIGPDDYGYVNFIFTRKVNLANDGQEMAIWAQSDNINKLSQICPNWQSDQFARLEVFNNYAVSRYGSWAGAYNAWNRQKWW